MAIILRGVSKKYPIYESPVHRLWEALGRGRKRLHREFWALQNIDLEVPRGTTLGILGQNGSGKTTLLQIVAGIMAPTTGEVKVGGRVSTILELGAGFNPDFSGRENIYLSGLILGLSPAEMRDRSQQIIEFAEIGEFIEQPVKTYSAGMYVRLAFAVAINLEPEVLVVDEVLSVGDAYFQHKCARKIREFQEAGKTIVYVTHDVESVRNLCHRALLLDYSRMLASGDPGEIANRYLALIDQREKNRSTMFAESDRAVLDRSRYHPYFDFYQEFERAEKIAPYLPSHPELLERTQYPGAHQALPAILAHPDSSIVYHAVPIRPECVLAAGWGLLPECWDKPVKGVTFTISLLLEGEKRLLAEELLDPAGNPEHRKIKIVRLDLGQYAGKKVSLVFSTRIPDADKSFAWSCWIQPQLAVPLAAEEAAEKGGTEIAAYSRYGRKEAEITRIEILNEKGEPTTLFQAGETMSIRFHVRFNTDVKKFVIGNIFRNKWGLNVYGTNTEWIGLPYRDYRKGDRLIVTFRHRADFASGSYSLNPATSSCLGPRLYQTLDWINNATIIEIINPRRMEGYVSLPTEITVEQINNK